MKTQPIGELKTTKKVYCTICSSSITRNLKINVFQNTPEAIQEAKISLAKKANAKYTCKVCKSILKDVA